MPSVKRIPLCFVQRCLIRQERDRRRATARRVVAVGSGSLEQEAYPRFRKQERSAVTGLNKSLWPLVYMRPGRWIVSA